MQAYIGGEEQKGQWKEDGSGDTDGERVARILSTQS